MIIAMFRQPRWRRELLLLEIALRHFQFNYQLDALVLMLRYFFGVRGLVPAFPCFHWTFVS